MTRKKNWKLNKHSFICSVHFEPSSLEVRAGNIGCKLCNDAVPSNFPSFPEYYQNQKVKRKTPQKGN